MTEAAGERLKSYKGLASAAHNAAVAVYSGESDIGHRMDAIQEVNLQRQSEDARKNFDVATNQGFAPHPATV